MSPEESAAADEVRNVLFAREARRQRTAMQSSQAHQPPSLPYQPYLDRDHGFGR
jgi:hypothetical protein